MPRRYLVIPVAVAALLVAGCSSPHGPKTDPPPTRSAASTTASTTAATTAGAGPAATPTPGTVPVDQIPPGRPATWIPAGVTTIAPWKEPGDVVPKFTLAMFVDDPAGVFAAVSYYVQARNWAFATLDPTAFLLLCKSSICEANGQRFRHSAALNEHVKGARHLATNPQLRSAPRGSGAAWIVRLQVTIEAGSRIDASGKVVETQPATKQINDLYMRWSGIRWLVQDDAVGR